MSKFCPNCGRSLPDDAVFCDGCGTSLSGGQSTQQNTYQQQNSYPQQNNYGQQGGYPQQNTYRQPNSYPQSNTYQQSSGYPQQNYAQQGNGKQEKEKKSRLPLLVGICAVALLAAGGLFLFRNAGKTDGGGEDMPEGPVAYKVVEKPAEEEGKEQNAEESGKELENTEETERMEETGEETTTGEEQEEPQEEETAGTAPAGSMDAMQEPVFDDFSWLIDYVPPTEEERIRDAARITGTWKCYSYYFDVYDAVALDELSLVTISGDNDSITVSEQQLGLYSNGNLELDEHGYAPLQYTGTFEDGKIYTAGDGNFAIDDFSEKDGKQYAVGWQVMPSGEEFTIYMVRP